MCLKEDCGCSVTVEVVTHNSFIPQLKEYCAEIQNTKYMLPYLYSLPDEFLLMLKMQID